MLTKPVLELPLTEFSQRIQRTPTILNTEFVFNDLAP